MTGLKQRFSSVNFLFNVLQNINTAVRSPGEIHWLPLASHSGVPWLLMLLTVRFGDINSDFSSSHQPSSNLSINVYELFISHALLGPEGGRILVVSALPERKWLLSSQHHFDGEGNSP